MARTVRPAPPSKIAAAVASLGSLALFGVGTAVYLRYAPDVPVAQIAPVGDPERVREMLLDYPDGALQDVQSWDTVMFLVFGLALLVGCDLGRRVFSTTSARKAATTGLLAGGVAIACDLAENAQLYFWAGGGAGVLLDGAALCASLKWALLLVATPVAIAGHAVTLTRLAALLRPGADVDPKAVVPPPPCADDPVDTKPPAKPGNPADEASQHWLDGRTVPPGRGPAEVGVCVSGGGIRSGCVTLGALQSLRTGGVLQRADYLVSVSGGGYVAAAFQLAMQPLREADGTTDQGLAGAGPDDVFAPGSVEEDHLRRHSNYLSDGAREWAAALLAILRGLLSSLTLVALTVIVLGIAMGWFYSEVPYADLDGLRMTTEGGPPAVPDGTAGLLTGLLLGAAASYGLWLVLLGTSSYQHWPTRVGRSFASVAALVALVGIGFPLLFWASSRLVENPTPAGATQGAVGPVLLSYVGTLVGLLWRGRKKFGPRLRRAQASPAAAKAPAGLVQRVIVLGSLLVLVLALVLLLGVVAVESPQWPMGWRVGLPALLVLAYVTLDQTWLTLHPFYRRRLATAFSVRRARRRGLPSAQAYDWDETTRLDVYAKKVDGFPRLLLAAAANLSGQSRTPPGRKAVSFTFGADWVGGPKVGYVRTDELIRVVPNQLGRDLTLQAAVAISGAAFASAMGRHARAYETFLALSNARLGTWLPNPAFLLARAQREPDDWTMPRLPRLRRLSYQLREIIGLYADDDRLLLCTDGGHVENLGLVELLRHGVRDVVVIDASGDTPPFAGTLAEALSLAREELGVEIALDDPLSLVPGSASPLSPSSPLADLNGRLSAAAVVTGTITYPYEVDFPGGPARTGRIVVAKASLTADMPYSLLAYAATHSAFPRDTTSDQWFDVGQFDAYTAMGRLLGTAAAGKVPAPTGGTGGTGSSGSPGTNGSDPYPGEPAPAALAVPTKGRRISR